jgi:hypothetical protein
MLSRTLLSVAALLLTQSSSITAQRPNTTSICDYYAEHTVGSNTAENQRLLMALVLHTALLGAYSNYSTTQVSDQIGALTATTYQGGYVDLNGYFNGGFASANQGGDEGVAVNFFDDGGLDATRNNLPANGQSSAQ